MFAQFAAILALGLGLAAAAADLGEGSCAIDKDFKLLQAVAKLEARIDAEKLKTCTKCKDGWTTFYGGCYYFEETAERSWNEAKLFCEGQGAHLLTIDSKPEDVFVHDALGKLFKGDTGDNIGFWFGAEDLDEDGHWEWYDTHKEVATTYSHWESGQGDNHVGGNEHCGCLWHEDAAGFTWHDCGCEEHHYVVCEKH